MDRTVIAPWKAEEKDQSEKLYKKLQGLSLLYPMNEEMLKLMSWDIFLKPNQPAFFQVMHYLFRILDPAEFKRRFFWPITDKKSEANFRASTIDYLKHLNAKHNLNWTNIKSYLVVMPGGMKFINFLLDLVGFVVQELTKQREKALSLELDISKYRDWSVESMSEMNAFRKEYTSAYIEELAENGSQLRERTQIIKQKFAEIAIATGVDESKLQEDIFLENFEASNRRKCEEKISQPAARIALLEEPLNVLKDAMDRFQVKQAHNKQNKESAENALRGIQKLFGAEADNATDSGVRANALLTAFNGISETVAEHLDANDHYSEFNDILSTDLEAMQAELQQIERQVNDVQRNLNARIKEHSSNISGNGSLTHITQLAGPSTPLRVHDPHSQAPTLLMKFVSTPPIRPEIVSGVRNAHVRLPLQDDFNAKQFETTCNSMLAPPRSARKIKQEQFSELNNTMNRSRIVDPMQLLRTINKKSVKVNKMENLSALGSKWKQMQATFGFDEPVTAVPSSPKYSAANSYSFTPLNCNERTRIERQPQPLSVTADTSNSSLYAKKSVALMKVLDASLNVENLSTSPSGRLDALVPGPLPHLQLNDQTINDSQQLQCSGLENDGNHLNKLPPKFSLDLSDCVNNDELQNISDSVLKDVSF